MNMDNMHAESCEAFCVHTDVTERVRGELPATEELYDLAELFRVFGDTTRIRILYALFEEEMCVCDIAEILSLTPSAISHQLKFLKQFRLVKSRRDGKTVYYSLGDDHVRTIIDIGREHIEEM
jgi:Predicted transcriptional regulators